MAKKSTAAKKTLSTAEKRAKKLDQIKKLQAELEKVESEELGEKLENFRIRDLFAKIKQDVDAGLKDAAILTAIGKAAGMKNFKVVLEEAKKKEGGAATRKKYDQVFKNKAVEMVNSGKAKSVVCKELDITPSSLNNWIKAATK